MRIVTATHASRRFSALLDAVEQGETVWVTRAGHVVAEMRAASLPTGRRLREALEGLGPLDGAVESDIEAATALLTSEWGHRRVRLRGRAAAERARPAITP